jgi:glycosyltransferase involved in cell wall biosynthesis
MKLNHRAPRVSVLLAVRNAADTLDRALTSIRDQSLTDWEFLIVDDHSGDDSPAILREFAAADSRVRLLKCPRPGLVPALNHGLEAARGEFIARMDADDLSHPQRLERQVALLDTSPDLDVAGCLVEFGGDPVTGEGYARHVEWLNTLLTPEAIALNRFIESPLANPSTLFRRRLLDRFGGYREGAFPEDYEFWLRLLEGGVRMGKVPEVLFTWNDSPGRLTRNDTRYRPGAFYAIKAEYLAREVARHLNGREVWIWGAGRLTRRRAERLEPHGIRIAGYIDIDPAKVRRQRLPVPVLMPEEMPGPGTAFVLGYVGNRGARELIRAALSDRGFIDGADFLMAA